MIFCDLTQLWESFGNVLRQQQNLLMITIHKILAIIYGEAKAKANGELMQWG